MTPAAIYQRRRRDEAFAKAMDEAKAMARSRSNQPGYVIDVLPADLGMKVYDIVTMLDALERALATQRPAWPGG
ncbi:hypothetical protein ID867_15410 [Streptomyces parvulus]|nr:hypothetical protein [Streptomyces parvulus]